MNEEGQLYLTFLRTCRDVLIKINNIDLVFICQMFASNRVIQLLLFSVS